MIGIDMSSEKFDFAQVDPTTRKVLVERTLQRNEAGIRELLATTPPDEPWVVEPTGRYSLSIVEAAYKHGRILFLAPNRRAKAFLRSVNPRAKTDKIDSKGLALFALSQDLDRYVPKPAHVDRMDQLLNARKLLSKCRASIQQASRDLPLAGDRLKQSVAELTAQMEAVDRDIEALVNKDPEFAVAKSLDAVPGIGTVCAAALASRLKGKTFSHPDKFVAYCGLDIGVHQSGKFKGSLGITKQGDAELRRLLYLAAMSNNKCKQSPFKDQYARELAKGLPKKAALCAVARKLAGVCWSMVTHDRPYDASRVSRPPQREVKPPAEAGAVDQPTQAGAAPEGSAANAAPTLGGTQPT